MVVDFKRLRLALGAKAIRLAEESEIREMYEDCEVGAMPPFGELYGQLVVVDTRLVADADIFFNAGSHREAIRMRYRDFESLVHPQVAMFATLNLLH
jgi:Ala-tRNA(Pro) deacylase